MMEELNGLPRLPVPPDFKARVQDRIDRMPAPRRFAWVTAFAAAAAGILVGLSSGWMLRPEPPRDPEEAVREHARRAGLFLQEAAQATDPAVVAADYAVSGLESQTAWLTSYAPDVEYVTRIARPLAELATKIREGDREAFDQIGEWARNDEVWMVLGQATEGFQVASVEGVFLPGDVGQGFQIYVEARAHEYEGDIPGAVRRFRHLAEDFPDCPVPYEFEWRTSEGEFDRMILVLGPGHPTAEAWGLVVRAYPEEVDLRMGRVVVDPEAWLRIAEDDTLREPVRVICEHFPLASPR